MEIADVLSADCVAAKLQVKSKKRVLETISEILASNRAELTSSEIFERLLEREKLGSTGLGHGVAIPHGRLKTTQQTYGAFVQLAQAIDFDALDDQPVDLLFALLVPENSTEEHLQILARIAEMFSVAQLREQLRKADSPEQLFDLLIRWVPESATA